MSPSTLQCQTNKPCVSDGEIKQMLHISFKIDCGSTLNLSSKGQNSNNASLTLLRIILVSGFHRPLGVIPPSSSVSPGHSRSPGHSSAYHLPHPQQPRYHAHYPAPTHHMPGPAAYGAQFPSHFYPEKLYQYWHHYYPRIPGISALP